MRNSYQRSTIPLLRTSLLPKAAVWPGRERNLSSTRSYPSIQLSNTTPMLLNQLWKDTGTFMALVMSSIPVVSRSPRSEVQWIPISQMQRSKSLAFPIPVASRLHCI